MSNLNNSALGLAKAGGTTQHQQEEQYVNELFEDCNSLETRQASSSCLPSNNCAVFVDNNTVPGDAQQNLDVVHSDVSPGQVGNHYFWSSPPTMQRKRLSIGIHESVVHMVSKVLFMEHCGCAELRLSQQHRAFIFNVHMPSSWESEASFMATVSSIRALMKRMQIVPLIDLVLFSGDMNVTLPECAVDGNSFGPGAWHCSHDETLRRILAYEHCPRMLRRILAEPSHRAHLSFRGEVVGGWRPVNSCASSVSVSRTPKTEALRSLFLQYGIVAHSSWSQPSVQPFFTHRNWSSADFERILDYHCSSQPPFVSSVSDPILDFMAL